MAKKKTIKITKEGLDRASEILNGALERKKPFLITNAKIKEGICEYSYEINDGPCAGDQIKGRKGTNTVHDDLENSFLALNVHLAILDDHFKGRGEMTFQQMDEDSSLFTISGFKVSGSDENEGYTLVGEKFVSHGHVSFETPKISKGSAYPYWGELCESIENARTEVELYMEGKSAPKYEQGTLDMPEGENSEFDNPI